MKQIYNLLRVAAILSLIYFLVTLQWKKAVITVVAMVITQMFFPVPLSFTNAKVPKPGDEDFIGPLPQDPP